MQWNGGVATMAISTQPPQQIDKVAGIGRKQKSYILIQWLKPYYRFRETDTILGKLPQEPVRKLGEVIETTCKGETGPTILKDEIKRAIETTKRGKVQGPDQILVEVLKLIEQQILHSITAEYKRNG